MKRRNLICCLRAILLVLVSPLVAMTLFGETISVDDFSYSYDLRTKKATLTGYSGSSLHITIPASFTAAETYRDDDGEMHTRHHTITVTQIGSSAFARQSSIVSVSFHNKITTIASYAFFQCSALTSVTFPDSLANIEHAAFLGCTALASVTFNDSLTSINSCVFEDCTSLVSLKLPASLTSIGQSAFEGCWSLTSVSFPDSLISIGTSAFAGCSSLTSLLFPDSLTSIGESAFGGCSGLKSFKTPKSLKSLGRYALFGCSGLETAEIDGDCLRVGKRALSQCEKLGSVVYGEGVSVIEGGEKVWTGVFSGFYGCTNLERIVVKSLSVRNIPEYFCDVPSLRTLSFAGSITSVGESALHGCKGLTEIDATLKPVSVGYAAFSGCSSLCLDVDFSDCTCIESYAFYGCSSMAGAVSLPVLKTVSSRAFNGTGISGVEFGSVMSIGGSAFEDCTSLASVSFPDSLTSIGDSAFKGCFSLASVSFPDSLTGIGDGAFVGCSSLQFISFPESLKSIGNYAFEGCAALDSLLFPKRLTSIGAGAFLNCIGLKSFETPKSLEFLGGSALQGCSGLETAVLDGDGLVVGDMMFADCTSLRSALYGPGVVSIGGGYQSSYSSYWAFNKCTNLVSIVVESSFIRSIPDYFCNTPSLTTLSFVETITNIGNYALYNCSGLTGVNATLKPVSIGYYAFAKCRNLKLGIDFSVCENIGVCAFFDCLSMTGAISLPKLTTASSGVFENCIGLESVQFGASLASLGTSVFSGCTNASAFAFAGAPPSISSYTFAPFVNVKSGAVGTYTAAHAAEWEAVIDSKGYWNGLKMKPSYYTVIYDANNGTGARTTATVEWGEPTPAGDGTFTWEAHYFMGWAFEDVGGSTLGSNDVIPEPQEGNTLTLYAVWVANKPILTNDNYSVIAGSLQLNWENPEAPMPPNMTYEVRRGFTDNYEAAEILTNGYDKLSYVDTQFDSIGSTSRIWYWVKPENNLFEVSEPCVTKNRYFLSVGFSTYGPGIKDKGITKDDAELAAGVAADMGGFLSVRGTSDGMCITDKYGTLANLNAAIDVCANRVKPGDIFFCYLATHGSMGTEDIEPQLLLYQGQRLMYSRLAKWCEDITKEQARFICVIMSCHSEALMNGGKIPTNETVLDNLETCGLRKCGAYSDLSAWVTSCSAEELSWKLSASAFSRFTMAFCGNGWVKGYADVDLYLEDTCEWIPSHGDGRLTLREIAEYSKKMYIGGAKESNVKINNADLLSRIDVGASTKDNNVKALPAPQNVKIKGVDGIFSGDKQIVSWDAVPDADEYRIYRQYGSDEPVLACVVQWQTTSYEDYTRWSWLSTNYKYYIQAVNASAISVKSDKVAHLSVKRGTTQLTESDVRGYFAENGVTLADDLSDEDWRNIHDSDLDGDGVIAGIESISGVSPIDSSAQFSANITFENGQPKVTPVPDLGKKRQYTIYGKESLNDPNVDWVDVTDKDLSNYHFFKVTVDMP